jgi:hypothetical protein
MLRDSVWSGFNGWLFIWFERFQVAIFIFNCLLNWLVTLRAIALEIKQFNAWHLIVSSSPAPSIFGIIHELIFLPHFQQLLERPLLILLELIDILVVRWRVLTSLLRIIIARLRFSLDLTSHDSIVKQPPTQVRIRLLLKITLSKHVLVFTRYVSADKVVVKGIVGGWGTYNFWVGH